MSYDTAFKEIQKDPDVCTNCFRRRYNRFERNYVVDTYKGDVWIREIEGAPDERFRRNGENTSIPHDTVTKGMSSICACGFPPGAELRPLPKSLFFEYADHLEERLLEDGVTFDISTFRDVLSTTKSDPAEQFADDRIFAKAVSQAVQIANVKSSVGATSDD